MTEGGGNGQERKRASSLQWFPLCWLRRSWPRRDSICSDVSTARERLNSPPQRLAQETRPEPAALGARRERSISGCHEHFCWHGRHVSAAPPCCPGKLFLLSSSAVVVTRKYYSLHVLSIWWSVCNLYHSCTYFSVNINDSCLVYV